MIPDGWAPGTHEFTCPVCGGHWFGTNGATDDADAEGICKGPWRGPGLGGYLGCTFRWKRSGDSAVFRAPGVDAEGDKP